MEIIRGGYWGDEGYDDGRRVRYAAIPINKMLFVDRSGAEYEVLADLFLPDDDDYSALTCGGKVLNDEQTHSLVEKSFIMTGNEKMLYSW